MPLLLDEPIETLEGLTLLGDSERPGRIGYLPSTLPRLCLDEERHPRLELVLYRGAAGEGGFLDLEVELAHPEDALDRAKDALKTRLGPDLSLFAVPMVEGEARLTLFGQAEGGARFVKDIAGSAPGLHGTHRAAFSAHLDAEGAALARRSIEDGSVFAVATYGLAWVGLGPAYALRVEVDQQRCLDRMRFHAGAGVSTPYIVARADLRMVIEDLKETGAIKVDELDPLPGEDSRPVRPEDLPELIAGLLGEKWFRPTVAPVVAPPASPGGLGGLAGAASGGMGALTPSFQVNLSFLERQELRRSVYDLRRRMAGLRHFFAASALQVDLRPPPLRLLTAAPSAWSLPLSIEASTDWQDMDAIEVQLRYRAHTAERLLRPDEPRAGWTVPIEQDEEGRPVFRYQYRLRLHPKPGRSVGEPADLEAEQGWKETEARHLVVHPAEATGHRALELQLGRTGEDLHAARVVVEQGQERHPVRLDSDAPRARLLLAGPVRIGGLLVSQDGSRIPLPAQETTGGLVLVEEPPGHRLAIRAILADPTGALALVRVEIRGSDGQRSIEGRIELSGNGSSGRWSAVLESPAQARWQYREIRIGRDARIEETPWADGPEGVLVVGSPGQKLLEIRLCWLGEALEDEGLRAILVELAHGGAQHRALLRPGEPLELRHAFVEHPSEQGRWRYRLSLYRKGTAPETGTWQETTDRLVGLLP